VLRVIGASNERAHLLELLQVQNDEGPCLDCYQTGSVVAHANLNEASPWTTFAAAAVAEGYPSVCAVPLRLRELTLGCLNLFMSEPVQLPASDVTLAQALADVASIASVQDQTAREAAVRESRLQRALDSRIVIEQAKGMIAVQSHVDMDGAFSQLRTYARNHNERLTDVARQIISGSLMINEMNPRKPPPPPPRSSSGR
jgi:GAF domain-containing protein